MPPPCPPEVRLPQQFRVIVLPLTTIFPSPSRSRPPPLPSPMRFSEITLPRISTVPLRSVVIHIPPPPGPPVHRDRTFLVIALPWMSGAPVYTYTPTPTQPRLAVITFPTIVGEAPMIVM